MTLQVRVAESDPTPPFEQLRRQLADAIDLGVVGPGTRLPTVRQLAADLGVAPGTVMRAYAELEASGRLATRRGRGTTVVGPVRPSDPAAALSRLSADFVTRARAAGASETDIRDAVAAALDRLPSDGPPTP